MNSLITPALALLLQGSVVENMKQGIAHPDLSKFLVIGALLFAIGVAGVLTRRNIIIIFMSIELMLNAVNVNLVAFSGFQHIKQAVVSGQIFALFVIVMAAAEAAIALAIVLNFYNNHTSVDVDAAEELKG